MIKKLFLRSLLIFGVANLSAQHFTFDSDLEGFTENFSPNGVVTWDADGGAGSLKLVRSSNNANFGRSDGGGVDADATKYVKIVIKNLTAGSSIRVAGTGADANAGFKEFYNVLSANTTSYTVVYADMTGEAFWNGNLTNLWFAVRQNYTETSDNDGAYITSIEFLSTLPANEQSEFLRNPNFEDTTGISHFTGGQAEVTREITADLAQNGSQSLKLTHIVEPTKPNWIFTGNNFYTDYNPVVPANTEITMKVWVRSNRTTPATLFARLRLNHQLAGAANVDVLQTTSGTADTWEELTFTFVTTADASKLGLWFAFNWQDGDPDSTNPVNGDVFYLDNMSAAIGGVLSTEINTLEGVSVYPNPVKNDIMVKTINGGEISVYNILGSKVKQITTDLKEYKIDVSTLQAGIYMLKINSNGKQFSQKLIVK